RWWGWGDPERRVELPPGALEQLRAVLQAGARGADHLSLEDVRLEEPRISDSALDRIGSAGGPGWGRSDPHTRVAHAAGKSCPAPVALRSMRSSEHASSRAGTFRSVCRPQPRGVGWRRDPPARLRRVLDRSRRRSEGSNA